MAEQYNNPRQGCQSPPKSRSNQKIFGYVPCFCICFLKYQTQENLETFFNKPLKHNCNLFGLKMVIKNNNGLKYQIKFRLSSVSSACFIYRYIIIMKNYLKLIASA